MKRVISSLLLITLLLASVIAMIPASAATPTEYNVMGGSNKNIQFKGEGNVFYFDYHKYLDLGNKFEMTDYGNIDYMIRFPNAGTNSASVSDGVKTSDGVQHNADSTETREINGRTYNQYFGYSFKESVVADAITLYIPTDTIITHIDVYGGCVDKANKIFAKEAAKTLLATFENVQSTPTTEVTDEGKDPATVIVLNSELNEAFKLDYIYFAVRTTSTSNYYIYEIELNGILASDAADFSELKEQYAEINGLVEKDWTAETWENLESAIANAEAVNKNATSSATEIANAAAALKEALDNLKAEPANKTALAEAIVEAIELFAEEDYTPASWAVYKEALDAAQAANDNANISQSGVDKALENLQIAIGNLVIPADKTDLAAAIANVEKLNKSDYTPNSWEALQTKKVEAMAINDNVDATQDEVDAALGALNMAVNDLAKPGNNATLLSAITSAKALKKSDYNVAAYLWNIFQDIIVEAETVANDPNATQGEMDMALEALNEKIEGLGKPVSSNTNNNNNNSNEDADAKEEEDEEAEDDATDAPATEAPATQAPATEPAAKKSGCKSAVATTAVVLGLVTVLGTALVVKKED